MALSLYYLALCRLLSLVRPSRRSKPDKDIEVVLLRHEVHILERQVHGCMRFRRVDQAILVAVSRPLPQCRKRSFLATSETLIRWHPWRSWQAQLCSGVNRTKS